MAKTSQQLTFGSRLYATNARALTEERKGPSYSGKRPDTTAANRLGSRFCTCSLRLCFLLKTRHCWPLGHGQAFLHGSTSVWPFAKIRWCWSHVHVAGMWIVLQGLLTTAYTTTPSGAIRMKIRRCLSGSDCRERFILGAANDCGSSNPKPTLSSACTSSTATTFSYLEHGTLSGLTFWRSGVASWAAGTEL